MPLVPAKCPQCGANIEIDDSKDAGICKYCGTAFITEKAINNYNTYVTNNNSFAGASIVVQSDTENIEKLIERASTFIKLKEYDEAEKAYHEIALKYPMDYRGWFGIVISKTKGMTDISYSSYSYSDYTKIIDCFDKALQVAKPTEQEYVLKQKEEFKLLYDKDKKRQGYGWGIADICNSYNYRDVEKALGFGPLNSELYTFSSFGFVIENQVRCSVIDKDDGRYKEIELKCEKYVTKDNIQELLSGYDKKKKKDSSGGCYVATCVYGSYDCPEVWTLRRFRDDTLDATWYGRLFIKCYYAISPTIVKWFGDTRWFKSFWKKRLDKMVQDLNAKGVKNTQYNDKY